jgi:hypothetical protein
MYEILLNQNIDPFKSRVIKTSIEYGALLDESVPGKITAESLAWWLTGDTADGCFLSDVETKRLTLLYHQWESERIPHWRKKYMKELVKRVQRILEEKLRMDDDGTYHW